MRAIRTQIDDLGDDASELSGLNCTALLENGEENKDMARQEFKQESDINELLKRFGVNTPSREPTFGEIDFDTDLQMALNAVDISQNVHANLPTELKLKYPTWRSMINAASTGDLAMDLKKLADSKTVPPEPAAKPA